MVSNHRLGTRHIAEPTIKTVDPRGRRIYWIGQPGPEEDAGPGTDFYAVNTGYVSITPLHLDLTHYKVFEQIVGMDWEIAMATNRIDLCVFCNIGDGLLLTIRCSNE